MSTREGYLVVDPPEVERLEAHGPAQEGRLPWVMDGWMDGWIEGLCVWMMSGGGVLRDGGERSV
jgi:hypothetical protein